MKKSSEPLIGLRELKTANWKIGVRIGVEKRGLIQLKEGNCSKLQNLRCNSGVK